MAVANDLSEADAVITLKAALSKTRSEASGDLSSMPLHMADVGTDNFEQEARRRLAGVRSFADDMREQGIHVGRFRAHLGPGVRCRPNMARMMTGPQPVRFAMTLQQFTGPVHAKGVEDTAFYRYHALIAANDVGGHPDRAGGDVRLFNAAFLVTAEGDAAAVLAAAGDALRPGAFGRLMGL